MNPTPIPRQQIEDLIEQHQRLIGELKLLLLENYGTETDDTKPQLQEHLEEVGIEPFRSPQRVHLKDLMDAELLEPGTTLQSRVSRYPAEAVINEKGNIVYGGQEYDNPSAAGGAVQRKFGVDRDPNGWVFWNVMVTTGVVLDHFRQQYRTLETK